MTNSCLLSDNKMTAQNSIKNPLITFWLIRRADKQKDRHGWSQQLLPLADAITFLLFSVRQITEDNVTITFTATASHVFLQWSFIKLELYLTSFQAFFPSRRVKAVASVTVIIIICSDKSGTVTQLVSGLTGGNKKNQECKKKHKKSGHFLDKMST